MSSFIAELTNNPETKPGVFTTEFWTLVLLELTAFVELCTDAFNIPNQWTLVIMGALAGAYNIARGLAKSGQAHYPALAPDLDSDLDGEGAPGSNPGA